MLSNVILFVLSALVVLSYVLANVIMTIIAIKDGSTVSDVLNEQDYGLGKVGVGIIYWPTFIVLYIRSLLPINTKSCFDEEDDSNPYKYYSLSDILELPVTKKVIITPENYMEFLKYAGIANRNKDVEIDIRNETVTAKFFDSYAFYGIKIGVLSRYHKHDGTMRYVITCYNASRSK